MYTFLTNLGLLTTLWIFGKYIHIFVKHFILKKVFSHRHFLKHVGEWVVITGSTDGIGKAIAHQLAKNGLNLFLISRSYDKLQNVADTIKSTYDVKTEIFVADFTKADFYDDLKQKLNSLSSISCLINNVGMCYNRVSTLSEGDELSPEFLNRLITCNCTSIACMSKITLPKMLESPPQSGFKRFILNISSCSGSLPTPYLAVYGATKSFVTMFSKSLASELSNTCVKVQTFTPSYVATNMSRIKRASFGVPSAMVYAKSLVDMIGIEKCGCGFLSHDLIVQSAMWVPESIRSSQTAIWMAKRRDRYASVQTKVN